MLGKADHVERARREARCYQKPTLVRGPVLTTVTASATRVSAVTDVCWIARAAFGEQDLRWMIFREWLMVAAPAWFRNLYTRHGEAIGSWLEGRPLPRAAVRGLMMPAVTRTIRK